jgi:hypothetical protein
VPSRSAFGPDPEDGSHIPSPIGISGKFFTAGGAPLTIIEASDFSLFRRFLDDEDILPVLAQRRDVGFNCLRVWLLNASVVTPRIHPDDYPDFYDRLPEFVDLVAAFGLYLELTVFTSCGGLMPSREDQQRHLDRTAGAVTFKGSVLIELVNEADQYDNATATDLRRPPGVLISRGSNGADSIPPRHDNPWDFEAYHTNDLSEFQRKVGHNAMEWADQSGRPCLSNENTRFPDKDGNIIHAYDAAMGGALLCAGSCFHSVSGKSSVPFTGLELDCARWWVDGARSVPLEFQAGQYRHLTELEGPDCIRAYSRRLADGREHVVRIRP